MNIVTSSRLGDRFQGLLHIAFCAAPLSMSKQFAGHIQFRSSFSLQVWVVRVRRPSDSRTYGMDFAMRSEPAFLVLRAYCAGRWHQIASVILFAS